MQIRHIPAKSYRAIFKWGARDVFYTLDERLKTFIVEKLGLSREEVESPHLPGLDELTDVPPSKLTGKKVKALGELVGPENVSTESFSSCKARLWFHVL